MNQRYFVVAHVLFGFLVIKANFIDDVKNWLRTLTEEKKEEAREVVRTEAYKTFSPEWVWENITSPQLTKAGRVVAGAAAVGAATYGLYQWATRRGLGGVTNDFKLIDSKYTDIVYQIDKKYSDLKLKKTLTSSDKSLIKGLSIIIKNQIDNGKRKLEQLIMKQRQLETLIRANGEKLVHDGIKPEALGKGQ